MPASFLDGISLTHEQSHQRTLIIQVTISHA